MEPDVGKLDACIESVSSAAAAALRKIRSLTDTAPMGRAFVSIASLTDVSRRIESSLEAGDRALALGDAKSAGVELSNAEALLERMRKLSDSIDIIEAAMARPRAATG
jgi:hypothetical protein